MSDAEALYQLQGLELNILRRRKRLHEITAAMADNDAVKSAQAQVEAAQKTLTPLQSKARDLDLEMQSTAQKAQDAEQRLYSGAVKNPKEMQDIQQEIVSLKKRHGDLESTLLETMFAVETAEEALAAARAVLEAVTSEWASEHSQLLDEKKTLETEASQFLQERKQALASIPPESLKIYDGLKPRKNNQPVALLNGSACGLCGVDQTKAIEREAQLGQKLVYCANCGRILFYRG